MAALTFIAGAGALITGNILNERQSRRLEQFDKEVTSAKTELAKAQREAAEAQLALTQNIAHVATPRRIPLFGRNNDGAVREEKFKELEKYKGTVAFIASIQGEEPERLAADIKAALVKSGWKATIVDAAAASIPLWYVEHGVQVRTLEKPRQGEGSIPVPPKVGALLDLLGLDLGPPLGPVGGVRWAPDVIFDKDKVIGLTRYGFKFPDGATVITVGSKPTEEFFATHQPPPKK